MSQSNSNEAAGTIKLTLLVDDLRVISPGVVRLPRAQLPKLNLAIEGIGGLCHSLRWKVGDIELSDGRACVDFEPPVDQNLFASNWTGEEFIECLGAILDETSACISRHSGGADAFADDCGPAVTSCGPLQAQVQQSAVAAVSKLVKADFGIEVGSEEKRRELMLPAKNELWKDSAAPATVTETTVTLEAVSRDGKTGYDKYDRAIDLRVINSQRDFKPGDVLKGSFKASARRVLILLPAVDQRLQCTSGEGDTFEVDVQQLPLFTT